MQVLYLIIQIIKYSISLNICGKYKYSVRHIQSYRYNRKPLCLCLYLHINSNIHAIIEQIIFVPYVEPLTVSPCQKGNPPVPGNSPAKVTLIIYWQSAKGEREPVRLFFFFFFFFCVSGVCARERACVAWRACVYWKNL